MENELVRQFKNEVIKFDRELRDYYDEAVLREADERDTDYLVDLMYKTNTLSVTKKDNLETSKRLFNDIKKKFYDRKKYVDAYLDERDEEIRRANVVEEEEDEEEVVVAEPKEATVKVKAGAGRVIATILGIGLLSGTAVHTGIILHKNLNKDKANSKEETVEDTQINNNTNTNDESKDKENTNTNTNTNDEGKKEEEAKKNLVPGEYGTFLDATDDEQVQARAQYLYDNYYAQNMKYIDAGDQHLITVDNIANTIRSIVSGELPLDADGYKTKDGATVDDYTSVLLAATVNAGSTPGEEYYHFPGYLFAVDGSELSEFLKSYDGLYEKLVYSMNNHDDAQARDAIACLGYKFWNEWYLQGMYGDANPHTLPADQRYAAFILSIEPYNTTALEYVQNTKEPVCIEACIDYETKEKELLPVTAIKTALETGEWNQVSAKLSGMNVDNNPWLPLFYQELDDQLNWKYDHLNQKTLS